MAKIKVTVSGKKGVGKSTIIRLIETALRQKGLGVVIATDEGEAERQKHLDNGDYSLMVGGLRTRGVTVTLHHKTKRNREGETG